MRIGRKRIEFYSPFEKISGLGMHLRAQSRSIPARTQHAVIGIEFQRSFGHRPFEGDVLHFDAERGCNPTRQLVLQVENVAHVSVVAFAPQLYAADSIYELDRNTDPASGTAHIALNH